MFKWLRQIMAKVFINDNYICDGSGVNITKNSIIVNGVSYSTKEMDKVSIKVEGNINSVEGVFNKLEVHGDVSGDIETISGDVIIQGNMQGGDIETVSGDVKFYGANCKVGSIDTVSGNIKLV